MVVVWMMIRTRRTVDVVGKRKRLFFRLLCL